MKQKKWFLSLMVLTLVSLLLFTACSTGGSSSDASAQGVSVKVQIIKDGENLLDTTVTLEGENPTAGDAFKKACQDAKMAYTVSDGMYDGFAGYTSTQTDGWLFYHNGQLADKGANDVTVSDKDTVSFQYENYNEAFGLDSSSEAAA